MHSKRRNRARRRLWVLTAVATMAGGLLAGGQGIASAAAPSNKVLYVGTFNGVQTPAASTFSTIQAAVNASKSGDWILIAPGDYHESNDYTLAADNESGSTADKLAGLRIGTSNIWLRGMDRNSVIIDGTKSGSSTPCSSQASEQDFGTGPASEPYGRNGIVVWKANNVSIDNLTVCNFLSGSGDSGNGIWWDGGDESGKIGEHGYEGSYLTATNTYFANSDPSNPTVCATCSQYGIFSSNAAGPGYLDQIYANNYSDSGAYVGACQRECAVTINHAWMEHNALGYSGTNSGGHVQIENSVFDDNRDGLDTNTALTGDGPPPQNGRCQGARTSSVTGTHSCWVVVNNVFENNNDPNVPVVGTAGLGPVGTGMTISGGRYDTVMDNEFLDNEAWGIVFAPYPDPNTTSAGKTCTRVGGVVGTSLNISGLGCLFDPKGDTLTGNKFSGNATLGNPGNADYGNLLISGNEPTNCFSNNTEWNSSFTQQTGPATDANSNPAQTPSSCGTKTPKTGLIGSNTDLTLLQQLECDSGVLSGSSCSSAIYPQPTAVTMEPLPSLPTMPNPCAGVPTNLWCPNGSPASPVKSGSSDQIAASPTNGQKVASATLSPPARIEDKSKKG